MLALARESVDEDLGADERITAMVVIARRGDHRKIGFQRETVQKIGVRKLIQSAVNRAARLSCKAADSPCPG